MSNIATRLVLAVVLLLPGAMVGAPSAAAQEQPAGSAVTVSGSGDFADLKVTVDQTQSLINQTVRISWTGGKATEGQGDTANSNFLQIMQCWGDDVAAGPDRTQCQFGVSNVGMVGTRVGDRRMEPPYEPGELPVGPKGTEQALPFWPFDRERPTTLVAESQGPFYDTLLTNEVPVARTLPNGTGLVDFEVQTLRQAAGLGCGTSTAGSAVVRPCWLVIVPRGIKSADGRVPPAPGQINGSPLDPRVWVNRIVIRLDFLPQTNLCPLVAERPVSAHEVIADAVTKWQPALCANGGAVYGLSTQTDRLNRAQLTGDEPDLAIISNPVPADQQLPERPLTYAPVAVSGLTFAFNIVADPPGVADDPRKALDGQQFTTMNLTQRVVAKILTQSYLGQLPDGGGTVQQGKIVQARPARLQGNAYSFQADKDFLQDNPNFLADPALPERELFLNGIAIDTLGFAGTSDLIAELWDWILADPEAREFIAGVPDPWGMVINDANKGLTAPLDSFVSRDALCVEKSFDIKSTPALLCPLDDHPLVNSMGFAGRATSRREPSGLAPFAKLASDNKTTILEKDPRQPADSARLMAVVDSATAERYRLPTAKLRNAAGQFVAPDAAGLAAGVAAMKPSGVDGVVLTDPTVKDPAAYPLTSVSYAATVPTALDEAAAREYGAFLRYAAGPGQVQGDQQGQLPFGYLPLPDQLRAQTLAAATLVENRGVVPAAGTPSNAPPGGGPPVAGVSGGSDSARSGTAATGNSGSNPPATGGTVATGTPSATGTVPGRAAPGGVSAPAGGAAAAQTGTAQVVAASRPTPALPAPAVGALLVALLIGGGLAATAAPVTHLLSIRRSSGRR